MVKFMFMVCFVYCLRNKARASREEVRWCMHFQGQDTIAFGGRGCEIQPNGSVDFEEGVCTWGWYPTQRCRWLFWGRRVWDPTHWFHWVLLKLSIEVSNPTAPLTWGCERVTLTLGSDAREVTFERYSTVLVASTMVKWESDIEPNGKVTSYFSLE